MQLPDTLTADQRAALIIRAEPERRGLLRPTQDPAAPDAKEGNAG